MDAADLPVEVRRSILRQWLWARAPVESVLALCKRAHIPHAPAVYRTAQHPLPSHWIQEQTDDAAGRFARDVVEGASRPSVRSLLCTFVICRGVFCSRWYTAVVDERGLRTEVARSFETRRLPMDGVSRDYVLVIVRAVDGRVHPVLVTPWDGANEYIAEHCAAQRIAPELRAAYGDPQSVPEWQGLAGYAGV